MALCPPSPRPTLTPPTQCTTQADTERELITRRAALAGREQEQGARWGLFQSQQTLASATAHRTGAALQSVHGVAFVGKRVETTLAGLGGYITDQMAELPPGPNHERVCNIMDGVRRAVSDAHASARLDTRRMESHVQAASAHVAYVEGSARLMNSEAWSRPIEQALHLHQHYE